MEKLLEILSEIRPDVDFEKENALIDDAILDSLNIMEIIAEVSDEFDVTFSPADIVPENFNSAKSLWEKIQNLMG